MSLNETPAVSPEASNDTTASSDVQESGKTLVTSSDQKSEIESKTLLSQELANEEKKEPDAPVESVPENYEAWKVPEGFEINPELDGEFKTIAKELNLTQSQAQKLVDLQAKFAGDPVGDLVETYKKNVESWKQETVKEFGANLNQELRFARKALDTFGDKNLIQFLDETGFGNKKEFISFFAKAGKLLAEDSLGEGSKRAAKKTDPELFYPQMTV